MSTDLKTGLDIVHNLASQAELALLIAAASKRILELTEEDDFVFPEELKKRIDAIEARHAKGEGKTYTKAELRQHFDNLMASS